MLRVNPTGTKAWYVQLDRNHKRKIADAGLLTAAVARYRAQDVLVRQAIAVGKPIGKAGKLTLGEFLEGRYGTFKARTSKYGATDISRLCAALGSLTKEQLGHVGLSKLERWKLKRARKVSPATVNRELSMLRSALDQACKWKLLPDNPAKGVTLRKDQPRKVPGILREPERNRLMQVLSQRNDRLSIMVELALNTGLKRNELFALRWKDIYFGPNPSIIIEKSGKYQNRNRRIPLNITAVDALTRWQEIRIKRAYLVFPAPSGGQLRSVTTAWTRLMAEAQIRKFSLNGCRDDFAARLVRAGVPLTQVRDLLGHSTIALTERYAIFAPGELSDAVARLSQNR
jgi:integrase